MGRAGAYVAAGEGNLNSLWYNPANLATLDELTLTLDTAVMGRFISFKRAPRTKQNGELATYPEVSNDAPPDPIPQMLIGGPTPIEGLSWAGGLWTPYGMRMRFPADGPQRYTLVDSSNSVLAYIGLALAWEISDSLRIGAGFQHGMAQFEYIHATSGYSGVMGRPEDEDLDVLSKAVARDLFAPTANAGIWFEPIDHFQFAASLQLPTVVHDRDANFEVRLPSHVYFDNVELAGNTFETKIPLPLIARGSLRYAHERFDVELTGVFEQWSVMDSIDVSPNNVEARNLPGVGSLPIGPFSRTVGWRDTFSIRAGGSYAISNELSARMGYAYETGAPPAAHYSVLALDSDKHVFSGGATYDWGDLELDVSAIYYAFENRSIRNSEVTQIHPADVENELATIVGNGDYRVSAFGIGTGINYRF